MIPVRCPNFGTLSQLEEMAAHFRAKPEVILKPDMMLYPDLENELVHGNLYRVTLVGRGEKVWMSEVESVLTIDEGQVICTAAELGAAS